MLSLTTSELSAVTELNLENTLNTYTEPPHCINIFVVVRCFVLNFVSSALIATFAVISLGHDVPEYSQSANRCLHECARSHGNCAHQVGSENQGSKRLDPCSIANMLQLIHLNIWCDIIGVLIVANIQFHN